ncbi:MAG: nitrile hydratase accessory protein [Verrucomicrobiales bacterium]|jgi:nitrile hydratase accessory protein
MLAAELDGLRGPANPPRENGELVFREPWEARAFGLVVAMHQAGHYTWDEFRTGLIAEIDTADDDGTGYYRQWLAAFERLLDSRAFLDGNVIDQRVTRFEHHDRHDHDHDD